MLCSTAGKGVASDSKEIEFDLQNWEKLMKEHRFLEVKEFKHHHYSMVTGNKSRCALLLQLLCC